VKCSSTGARIISGYKRETWLRDQRHSTFTKLIRRAPPNQKIIATTTMTRRENHRGVH
jgi:hypothetical protein